MNEAQLSAILNPLQGSELAAIVDRRTITRLPGRRLLCVVLAVDR